MPSPLATVMGTVCEAIRVHSYYIKRPPLSVLTWKEFLSNQKEYTLSVKFDRIITADFPLRSGCVLNK